MSQTLLWTCTAFSVATLILVLILLVRSSFQDREAIARAVREEFKASREEAARTARELREEVAGAIKGNAETLSRLLEDITNLQRTQLEGVASQLKQITDSNQQSIEMMRNAVETQLKSIQKSNEERLLEMRRMVDERLQAALEARLGESFKLVSDRLEAVHRGLGEMQTLAGGVGDLKRMLTNVKARGIWGEIQLGALIEQILTPDQYGCNVCINKEDNTYVEYAVRLPGPDERPGSCMWLPIDAKFPMESYLRVVEAAEAVDADALLKASKALADAVRKSARDIHDKYLDPPRTTDFAVMFLPTESLYAEVVRQTALLEELQQNYRVVVAGPSTIAALLNSLRMGFRTLALQQKAGEVWTILAAVKTEFARFGDVLDKARKQLKTVSRTLEEDIGKRTRAMERKLRSIEELSPTESEEVLGLESEAEEEEESPDESE